jgi:alpha-tubulin suppressor-like RCC1 family protein
VGYVLVFGKNNFGQLGLGDRQNRLVPTIMGANLPFIVAVSAGTESGFAVTSDTRVV